MRSLRLGQSCTVLVNVCDEQEEKENAQEDFLCLLSGQRFVLLPMSVMSVVVPKPLESLGKRERI